MKKVHFKKWIVGLLDCKGRSTRGLRAAFWPAVEGTGSSFETDLFDDVAFTCELCDEWPLRLLIIWVRSSLIWNFPCLSLHASAAGKADFRELSPVHTYIHDNDR